MTALPYRTGAATWVVLGVLLCGAFAGLLGSLVPLSWLTGALAGMSGSGDTAGTIGERYVSLVHRARITSVVLLAGWAMLVWRREWLGAGLRRLALGAVQVGWVAPGQAWRGMQNVWRSDRVETVLFLLIMAVGIFIRLYYLGRDIRHDEAWTYVVYARRPFYLSPLVMSEVNHHPLNTMLIQVSVALFGNAVEAIRLPAFLFGVACIPAGYALGRQVWGRGTGLIAAALIAGSSPLIEYSVNARGYSAVTFCGLIMLGAGYRAVRTGSGVAWTTVVLAGMAGTYANPVMMLPGIVAFGWFLSLLPVSGRAFLAFRDIIRAGVGVAVGTLFLYLPFFTVSGWDAIASSQGIKAHADITGALATAPRFSIALLENWDRDFSPSTALIAVLLALLSVVLARRRRWACFGLLVAIGGAALFQFVVVRDAGPERVWLSFLPMLLILAAAGLDGSIGRFGGGAVVIPGFTALVLGGLMAGAVVRSGTLLSSVETGYFPGAREVARDLVAVARSDLVAITAVRGDDVAYYAMRQGLLITPVRSELPLRLYRPPVDEDRWLFLVLDKALRFCSVEECVGMARRLVPTVGDPELLRDDPGYVEFRLQRAGGS